MRNEKKHYKQCQGGLGSVRIIAGRWRGRKLPVLNFEGLRPSSDRMRETLFNWLMPYVVDSRCLDLFAGTGALGFEASSRGALTVDFVELNREVCNQLFINIEQLGAKAFVHRQSAESYLKQLSDSAYDIVFVDPPFDTEIIQQHLDSLSQSNCLVKGALIYVESGKRQSYEVPKHWSLLREKSSKQVLSCLFIVDE